MAVESLESFSFVVDGRPRPKERPRLGRRGRVYTPVRTIQYEHAVRDAAVWCVPSGWALNCQYSVEMTFAFNKGAVPDVDNCCKSLLDGLNGVAWDDDRQVVQISALRVTCKPGEAEHALVTVHRVSEALPAKRKARPKAPKPRANAAAGDALMKVFKMKRAPRRRGRS